MENALKPIFDSPWSSITDNKGKPPLETVYMKLNVCIVLAQD